VKDRVADEDGQVPTIRTFEDSDALARGAADEFLRRAVTRLQACASYSVVLSGGATPKRLFGLLAAEPYRQRMPWARIHFFWGDERTVPPEHEDSNYGAANQLLLSRAPIPPENVHRIPAERHPPARAASDYEATLRREFRLEGDALPRFDLAFLGLGADGHTASLFPGTAALAETRRMVVANWIEKLETHRITLTCPVFNRAACVLFLVSGTAKSKVLAEILADRNRIFHYPAELIRPLDGELCWYIDRAAGRALDQSAGGTAS
jgi:6-phosphogluconolactonase